MAATGDGEVNEAVKNEAMEAKEEEAAEVKNEAVEAKEGSARSHVTNEMGQTLNTETGREYETNAAGQKINKMKKRKVALYIGYYGAAYQGMQRNPGAHTIEDVLEKAIHEAGGISDNNFGELQKISWMRAARTDKGVSAACNVVSLKMVLEPEGIVERINEKLPDDVRVFGYFRVTNGFCARKMCDRRRYGYVLPLWALDPSHPVRGNKRQKTSEGSGPGGATTGEETGRAREEEILERFNRILKEYEGTHNFHSFTKGKAWNEPQAQRYILNWKTETFELNGETYVKCEVLGQSFLYHQIRKMIGLALAISRNIAPESVLGLALASRKKFNVPVAPEFPLYLEECVFNSYNKKHGHLHGDLSRDRFVDTINDFKRTTIDRNIVESEEFNDDVSTWLRGLKDELYQFSKWEAIHAEFSGNGKKSPEETREAPPKEA
ncbi:tRNA pseudouridine synthase [Chloropicon primus]|uniref:tRNA pseudouridine synthase n=1 Tax=Chloropicon primus TaxID=1764295 RepID=A0A5B8MCV0_9CHLO|nr:tRNA pseudouridine synthase [Chloropicon primus]UPQ97226.1 tRNA pseudouridine synthase [Chloropicon primus]|eukprot:QDZ18011.1 tRNA pseudouridine synthase [Chloropicon primus]